MIPEFDDNGNLPPGFHLCTVDEIQTRFGRGSAERETETAELAELVEFARQTGVKRLLVDGSYSTIKRSPVDVDVVMLMDDSSAEQMSSFESLCSRWPFIHAVVVAEEAKLEEWAKTVFCTDRRGNERGIPRKPSMGSNPSSPWCAI